jgi:hypothetical protein
MTLLARVGALFPRNTTVDTVQTTTDFPVPPEDVWRGMLFYEEIPRRPGALLRWVLPLPIATRGDKHRVGAIIECQYEHGYLEKQITGAHAPRSLEFAVRVQRLGIEDSIVTSDGSYTIEPTDGGGSHVVLTTRYVGHLRPRWVWRPVERWLAHRVHRHILDGMRPALQHAAAHHAPQTTTALPAH